jgi:hypothetical protein
MPQALVEYSRNRSTIPALRPVPINTRPATAFAVFAVLSQPINSKKARLPAEILGDRQFRQQNNSQLLAVPSLFFAVRS